MIAGTSTGGIIALGLGLGIPAPTSPRSIAMTAGEIFPPLPREHVRQAGAVVVFGEHGPKLNHDELESALKRRFGDHLLGNSTARLVIPAFMMPKTEIAVFKTDHHEDFRNDHGPRCGRWRARHPAAPTYLKGLEHQESGRIFIDGGVWANNPAMVALVDALTAYDVTFDQIEMFSIGTGNAPFLLRADEVLSGLDSLAGSNQGGDVPDDRQRDGAGQASAGP